MRRGAAAGLVAGALAALFALVFAEPAIDAAIELEEAHAAWSTVIPVHDTGGHGAAEAGLTRATQKLGLVTGMLIYGTALGGLFGVAAAWARGRLRGDAWSRSLKLGVSAVLALVVLPALAYPPNPPAVGDPDTVGARTLLTVGVWVFGLLVAAAAWSGARRLETRGWSRPGAQTSAGVAVLLALGVLFSLLPPTPGAGDFPADLLWSFRLGAIATQTVLFASLAVVYGLLAVRAEWPGRHASQG